MTTLYLDGDEKTGDDLDLEMDAEQSRQGAERHLGNRESETRHRVVQGLATKRARRRKSVGGFGSVECWIMVLRFFEMRLVVVRGYRWGI